MNNTISGEDVLVCIVLYKQSLLTCNTFKTLLKATGSHKFTVLVYNNSPATVTDAEQPITGHENIHLLYYNNYNNDGVTGAYNYSATIAKDLQKKYLFFFDQDTFIAENYFTKMLEGINNYPAVHLFCPVVKCNTTIISPAKYYLGRAITLKTIETGLTPVKAYTLINSGMAISLNKFMEIGGYDTQLKLDFSDHYFFYKYKKQNKQFVVVDVCNNHELSSYYDKNYDKVLHRFRLYVSATKIFSIKTKSNFPLIWAAIRGIKLFFIYKKKSFLVLTTDIFRK